MEGKTLIFPLLAIVLFISQTEVLATESVYTNFIKTKCNNTSHPSLCEKTLMPYAFSVKTNSMRLYEEAVKVAIKGARSASVIISYLSKEKGLSQYEAKTTKVCIKSVKNSVHQFKKSVKAIGDMIGEQDEYELFYARSYAYSALTNLGSCIDGFADQPERQINSNGKKVIDRSMSVISKLGNAALSLISHR